jgi:3-oxoacyl-[acyl-carrier protein] reductase
MNIVITGAGKGIGFELTKLLGKETNNHVIGISRNCSKLQALQQEIPSAYNITSIPFDLVSDNMDELVTTILTMLPHIDILINNAGALVNKPFEQITSQELEYIYQVNVFSVFKLTQKLLPLMRTNVTGTGAGAHIVNISSMGGVQGSAKFAGLSAYSSSKGALTILTECMAEEFNQKGIRVNCLALGAVQTEMLSAAFPGYNAPLNAAQMATFIANFAVNNHQYINGKTIQVSVSTP